VIDEREERGGRRNAFLRAAFAAVVVATAHAAVFVWLSAHNLSAEPPDSVQGVPIDLDLLAVAPREPPHDMAPPPAAAPPSTPDAMPTPDAAPSPEPPPPTPEPPPTQEPPPPPSPEPPPPTPEPIPPPPPAQEAPPPALEPSAELPTPTPEPTKTPPPNAVVEPAPPPPKPKPPPPKARPEPPKPKPRPSPSPSVDQEKLEKQRERADEKAREREDARRQARSAAAVRESNDTARASNDSRQGASQRPVSSGTNLATWRGEVLARISEFKPSSNGASGTAVVAFTVDGGGRVVSASLVRSSGDSALDSASVAMVRRASPVPAPPPELGGHVNLTVPVRFQ
jgi:periplasmic protein TonB